MRVAVFGGSFNPPHVGHGLVSSWILWTGLADEVWLMPTYAHALAKSLPSFETRVDLCERFARDVDRRIQVTCIEQDLPMPSYSIDSLRALRHRFPEHEFRFVIGSDILEQTDRWKQWSVIESEFCPIIVGRYGFKNAPDVVVFPGVSSTEVRNLIERKEPFSHLVTRSVHERLLQEREV